MRVFINRYKGGCTFAKDISDGLNAIGVYSRVIKQKNSKYVHKLGDLVINWGDSKCPDYHHMLNRPQAVALATNKIKTFNALVDADVSCVPVMLSKEDAVAYLKTEGTVVFCRGLLNAARGKGIVVASNEAELIDCKLYTGGISSPERIEYRVHVIGGKAIHLHQKKRRNGWRDNPDFSDTIRNLKGGWVFAVQNVSPSKHTVDTAIKAVEALGLDFGAVDIVEANGIGYVLEVNTAPGITGSTPAKYCEAFKEYVA